MAKFLFAVLVISSSCGNVVSGSFKALEKSPPPAELQIALNAYVQTLR